MYNLAKSYLSLIPKPNSSESGLLLPLWFYLQRKLDFSRDIQRLDITRLKLLTQSTLSLVPKIIGLLKHGGIRPQKQCCQLSWIIQETPDFGPYLPVSRLEYTNTDTNTQSRFTRMRCQPVTSLSVVKITEVASILEVFTPDFRSSC